MVRMGSAITGPLPAVMSKGMFMPARRRRVSQEFLLEPSIGFVRCAGRGPSSAAVKMPCWHAVECALLSVEQPALLTGDGGEDIGEQDDAIRLECTPGLQRHLHRDVHVLCRGAGGGAGRGEGAGQEGVRALGERLCAYAMACRPRHVPPCQPPAPRAPAAASPSPPRPAQSSHPAYTDSTKRAQHETR